MKQPSFFQRVYSLVRQIPAGACASYSQLAYLLGAPRAARQVGWAMRTCPDDLPCSAWSKPTARLRAAATPI